MDFAILAGLGKYADDIVPISPLKGPPLDASEETWQELLFWGCYLVSWLTLRELHRYNWGAKAPPRYHVDFFGQEHQGEQGKPTFQKIYHGPSGSLGDEAPGIRLHLMKRLAAQGNPDDVRIVFGFHA